MKYYIIGDTHFGHRELEEYCDRPENFESLIIKNWVKTISKDDLLIHLGDVCLGDNDYWHRIMNSLPCRSKILCLGNHDSKSMHWYLNHGWNFVCNNFTMSYMNKDIIFSHLPLLYTNYDLNIHAHCHTKKRELFDKKQYLFTLEHEYKPVLLDDIILSIVSKKY